MPDLRPASQAHRFPRCPPFPETSPARPVGWRFTGGQHEYVRDLKSARPIASPRHPAGFLWDSSRQKSSQFPRVAGIMYSLCAGEWRHQYPRARPLRRLVAAMRDNAETDQSFAPGESQTREYKNMRPLHQSTRDRSRIITIYYEDARLFRIYHQVTVLWPRKSPRRLSLQLTNV